MGYAYTGLAPAAILLDNPGITRERFIKLLSRIHESDITEFGETDPWGAHKKEREKTSDSGLEELAGILNLRQTPKYKSFEEAHKDEHGIYISPPYAIPLFEEEHEGPYKFEVRVHTGNVLEAPIVVEELAWGKLKVGDVWEECQMGEERGIVTKIFEEKCLVGEGEERGESGPEYEYKIEIRPIRSTGRIEKFKTKDEMLKAWPQFHPDFMFAWSQERGRLSIVHFFNKNDFRWRMKRGRYYLDDCTFDRISPFFTGLTVGYHDLILTAEAIKHQAWKLLSYRGRIHVDAFLKDFPGARKRYERAVWDSYTSLYAKSKGMSVSDFLRFRALNRSDSS